jgi:basic membrane lipoprotein Med (substrate-binding protein (PBP1-ABC) superfamily)
MPAVNDRRQPPAMARASRWWRRLGRWRWAAVACVVLVIGGLTGGVLATGGGGPAPRARIYLAFTACLLTNSQGLASPQAAAAWAGMQTASLATRAKVQYLAVPPGTSAAGARPYLASLLVRKCGVVVATGPAQAAAVAADAPRYGSVRFAVVGGRATASNVTVIPTSPGAMRSAVSALVTSAVAASG